MTTSQTPAPERVHDRVSASADNWKRRLLDLTKRNRALNFRPTKVSTVAVLDERPSEVFRQLYLRERSMRFKAAPEDGAAAAPAPPAVPGVPASPTSAAASAAPAADPPPAVAADVDDEYELVASDFAPYDPATLDERHTDDWLQTSLTPEALDKSLRRLDEQSRLTIEEQGVNTMFLALGMLHYKESADSDVVLRAPLVLLPVELVRKSARTGYTIRATDDDPIVNPALAEYLRRSYGIQLPELPDANAMAEDYDLQTFFAAATDVVAAQAAWSVRTEIVLALFSFQKFVMYKDLEQNAPALVEHRLVRQLVTRTNDARADAVVGLPADVRDMELDEEYPPEQTFQVVDADASQLRAIAASARGYDLVIEGPPGTGKSQTITNLIAQALAAGKSVLFVAEKMAALQVVYSRLVAAGLGEFCLELHSTKANKRLVMKELAATLDASLQRVAAPATSTQRLPQVRATLADYVQAVHGPHGVLGVSPYHAYGELGRVRGARRVSLTPPIDAVTREQLEQTVRDLTDLAAAASPIGIPAQHPWRDTTRTFYTTDDLETVREVAADLARRLGDVMAQAKRVEDAFTLPPIRTFADVETAASVAAVLGRSPGAPRAVLESDAWNAPPSDATRLIERGHALVALRERIASRFSAAVLEQEHASDIAHVERKASGIFGFLAFLDGRWRAIRRRWMSYRLAGYEGSLAEQANEMKQVDRYLAERRALAGEDANARALFGSLWQGERSDWGALERYVQWVVEFRGLCVRHRLADRVIDVATHATPDVTEVVALRAAAADAASVLDALRQRVGAPAAYLASSSLDEIVARATALAEHVGLGPRWAAFESARRPVAEGLAGELLPAAMSGEMTFAELAPVFLRAFWLEWLSAVVRARPPLERFNTLTHEERVAEFRTLDERVLVENRAALVAMLRDRTQQCLREPAAVEAMPVLRREMARQRGLAPLRRTIRAAEPAIRGIKPCFMMSPLTVAQYLDGAAPTFDVVIFDEASQLPPEDAVGAIIRGQQLIVVGDPKQLPPTDFFMAQTGQVSVPVGEDGTPLYEDMESILEEYMGAAVPMSRLKWHYRSAHESLITFSNVSFYDAELYTFPSIETGTSAAGLQFELVEGGVYEGKGLNLVEARRVADEVVRFAREQLARAARGEPAESLGVGTFNLRQQLAIQDELEQRRRDDPSIELFFDRGAREPFFVKNLENIQGDERDVIFLSVTYARGPDGRLRYNFGPLNGENGWRRLNVLTTRARHRMRVFSSMRGADINVTATMSNGPRLLREFLTYAELGRLESAIVSASAATESPFEREVLQELTHRGLTLVPQVGVAGYRIDLGVLDDALPGRFVCGIECDGVAYHSSETARDRDRLRAQVLAARGWTIHRVWSTDWFKDREGQIERLLALIAETKTRAVRDRAAERAARTRVAEAERAGEVERAGDAARGPEASARSGTGDPGGSGAKPNEVLTPGEPSAPYVRPTAARYVMTPGEGTYAGQEILQAPASQLVQAVVRVVEHEGPIHETDLLGRVAGMWDTRAGSRIQARIADACRAAEREARIRRRGEFYWGPGDTCSVRSRAGTRIPADRIAPEEYAAAIEMVLAGGHAFSRAQLTTEVRAVLGYSRTGAALDEAIGAAIDALLAKGRLGEASTGIRLR